MSKLKISVKPSYHEELLELNEEREGGREEGREGDAWRDCSREKEERKLPAVDSELERRASRGTLWVQ